MKRKFETVSLSVDIDLDDIAEALSDDQIVQLAEGVGASTAKQSAIVAINEARAGRVADAITTLEREFLPKWTDRADCQVAYDRAMGRAA